MRRPWILCALGACGTPDDLPEVASPPGIVALCAYADGDPDERGRPAGATEENGTFRWDVSGTVVAVDGSAAPPGRVVSPCPSNGGRTLDLRTAEGVNWRVGWYITEGTADDLIERSPVPDLTAGDTVDMTLLLQEGFGASFALALSDERSLVLAAEDGIGARFARSAPARLGGLEVRRGDPIGQFYSSDCGRFGVDLLVFDAGDGEPLPLGVWVEGTVEVGGTALQARNVGAYSYVGQPECTDVGDVAPWVVWRP